MGVNCEQVWREISNYLDDDVEPGLRAALEEHFRGCKRCTSVLEGTRNVIRLYGDPQMFELPIGFSQRLQRRIDQSLLRPRGTAWGWVVALAASLLLVGSVELGQLSAFTTPALRSELADPASSHIPEDMQVVVTTDGKTEKWVAETPPPNGLYRAGWRQTMIKGGEELTVNGFLSKDGDNLMWAQSVDFADGRRITLNSSPLPQAPGAGRGGRGGGPPEQ